MHAESPAGNYINFTANHSIPKWDALAINLAGRQAQGFLPVTTRGEYPDPRGY